MIPLVPPSVTDPATTVSENMFLTPPGDEDWAEFSSYLNSTPAPFGNESILDIIDNSKASLQKALDITAAHPTAKNMFETTRYLSKLDLETLVLGKIVDKATKGIDRMLNMQ